MFPSDIDELARAIVAEARARGLTLACAESCTGGLVAGALTEVPGASDVFGWGLVTYANAAKTALLGVPEPVIAATGAVSMETARAMAEGALAVSGADLAVAVTGIAGPGGGSADKPVGLVWFAIAGAGRETQALERRYGDVGRSAVRAAAVRTALELFRGAL